MSVKTFLGILILFFILAVEASTANAQTQLELNEKACDKFKKADNDLNSVYNRILEVYKTDKTFIAKLKKAQVAWIAFRDAHIDAIFPLEDKRVEYGSVYPMCECGEREEITLKRISELKRWLDGIEEGDVCGGSIRRTDVLPQPKKKTK